MGAEETAWAIARSGFASLATLDEGFFGKGMYFTTCADYAAEMYAQPNLDEEYPLLLCWVLLGEFGL